MYGLVNQAIQEMVVENFGDELHKRIYEDYMTKPYPFMINPSRGFTG